MVSVIIPVFNSEKYISKTLDSILAQTYTDYEIILVDDKSTDKSIEVIGYYIQKHSCIKVIRLNENSGAAVARNKGIEQSNGKYIAFVDSDDTWEKTKLEKQVAFMESNKYDFTYTYYKKVDENGRYIGTVKSIDRIWYKDMLKTCHIGCSTVMLNQENLGKVLMPLLRKRQDYATWLQVLKQTEYGVCWKEALTNYTVRADSISANKLKLVKYNISVFKDVEGFGYLKSLYYLTWNILYKIFVKK